MDTSIKLESNLIQQQALKRQLLKDCLKEATYQSPTSSRNDWRGTKNTKQLDNVHPRRRRGKELTATAAIVGTKMKYQAHRKNSMMEVFCFQVTQNVTSCETKIQPWPKIQPLDTIYKIELWNKIFCMKHTQWYRNTDTCKKAIVEGGWLQINQEILKFP